MGVGSGNVVLLPVRGVGWGEGVGLPDAESGCVLLDGEGDGRLLSDCGRAAGWAAATMVLEVAVVQLLQAP